MKYVKNQIVEAGVRSSGHPGVGHDFEMARDMNPGPIQVVARAASRQFSPAISSQRIAVRVPTTVGVVGTALTLAAIYLFA